MLMTNVLVIKQLQLTLSCVITCVLAAMISLVHFSLKQSQEVFNREGKTQASFDCRNRVAAGYQVSLFGYASYPFPGFCYFAHLFINRMGYSRLSSCKIVWYYNQSQK